MIPDVPLKGADGNIPYIGHAVRFFLIFFSIHQTCSVFEIFNSQIEFSGGNVSMSPVTIDAGILRKLFDPLSVNLYGVLVFPKVSGPASIPYHGIRIIRIHIKFGFGFFILLHHLLSGRRRIEGFS